MRHNSPIPLICTALLLSILACQGGTIPPATGQGKDPIASTSSSTSSTTQQEEGSTIKPPAWVENLNRSNSACFLHDNIYSTVKALTCLDEGGWHVYPEFSTPLENPTQVLECPDGRVVLSFDNATLYVLEGDQLEPIRGRGTYSIPFTVQCGYEADLWGFTNDTMYHIKEVPWSQIPLPVLETDQYQNDVIHAHVITPDNRVWVTDNNEVAVYDGKGWQVVLNRRFIKDILADPAGKIWVVSDEDVMVYDGGQWLAHPGVGDPYNDITTLRFGPTGEVLAVAGNENPQKFYLLDPQANASWNLWFTEENLQGARMNDLQFDGQGRIWLTTNYGLHVFDGSSWTAYHMFSADLYDNEAGGIFLRGDGPPLPALMSKLPGEVRGRITRLNSDLGGSQQVELCLEPVIMFFSGETPCANQPFHAVMTLSEDGSFTFKDIPAGRYTLMLQTDAKTWITNKLFFEVTSSGVTELGDISYEVPGEDQ
jgi:hypothetical protein